jgi:hypothetical protein
MNRGNRGALSAAVLLALVAGCGGTWGAGQPGGGTGPLLLLPGQAYVENPGFERVVADSDGTADPEAWGVTEGETVEGTGHVIREMPELVQVVGREGAIEPYEGQRMLKVDARLLLKSSVRQYYRRPVESGTLVQQLAVRPAQSGEYVQQIEVRGTPDFREVEGKELFHLRWTDEGLLLRVRTGSPGFRGQSGYWRTFPPLPRGRWSLFRITLTRAAPTRDNEGRMASQWRLRVELDGTLLFDTGRDGVYSQYIRSADFVFIGDETMSGTPKKLNPTGTGDGIGIVYYDLAVARALP